MKNIEEKNNILNEMNKKENSSNVIKSKSENSPSINAVLSKIFSSSKKNPNILLPLVKKICGCELINIFNIPSEKDSLITFIKHKIDIINEIRKLIKNKYEMIYIINNFLLEHDIILFKYFIDLYLRLSFYESNSVNEKINKDDIDKVKNNLQELFVWFINCGLLNKNITDYVFQNISAMQLEKKLNIDLFNIYIPLLEILYGKNTFNLQCDYIAKNYIYLFDRNKSIIKTNISPTNQINIKNGLCIILWFYVYEFCNEKEKSKGTICQIMTKDLQKIDIILNNNYDLEIKYNTQESLKEKNDHTFNIKTNIWTQLKIQFTENKIHLFICQNNDENNSSEIKYEKKTYLINYNKNKSKKNKKYNNNILETLKINDFTISCLNFFMRYEGLVGTILFYNNANYDKTNKLNTIKSIYGLDNDKINNFLKIINLKDFYFIISPSLYCSEDNKFMNTINNVEAELSLEKKENNLNLNSVININNYTKNIFYLGGCDTILPLFEIIYRFSLELDKNDEDLENDDEKSKNSSNDQLIISKVRESLSNLFKLLELIFINKKRNCIEAYKNSTHFFESLQLFLENIHEKYYNDDNNNKAENCIISSLLNIGKYFYEMKNKKIIEAKGKHGYFTNILFYPTILMKFHLNQQNIIFSFFEIIKKDNKFFKNNEYKAYFIPWNKILKLLILFSDKYKDIFLPSNLFNIIKIIFEDYTTTDNEREDLLLLYNNHLVSDKVFINIMEIFIYYFDFNTDNKDNKELLDNENTRKKSQDKPEGKNGDTTFNLRNNTIKYLLYSSNFFIEYLLNILLTKNLYIKKQIINFLRIITNKYYSVLEEYFTYANECNKTYKNERINKNDFYFFIKENIIINENNEKIIDEFEQNKAKGKNNKKYKRKESVIEEKNYKIKTDDIEDLSKKRTKSIDLQLNKNQRKKIIANLSKKRKRIRSIIRNIAFLSNKKRSNSLRFKKYEKNNKLDDISNEIKNYELYLNSDKFVFRKRNKSGTNLNKISSELYELNRKKVKEKEPKCLINYSCKNLDIKDEELKKINNISEKENDNIILKVRYNRSLTVYNTDNKIGKKLNNKKKKNKNKKKAEKNKNQNTIINEENNENEIDYDEDSNINCDISMILYDWLISIKFKKKESINNSKTLTIDLIDKVLNIFIKFLSNTIQLEVIHKTLSIIVGQKNIDKENNNKNTNNTYVRLLSYFTRSSTFKQLLEEILIDSYLGANNDKVTINKYNFDENKENIKENSIILSKKDLFEKIYILTKELLIDIYFYRNNEIKNNIIYDIYNIILKKYNGLHKKYNNTIVKIFYLLKNLFNEIIAKYHEYLNDNDIKYNLSKSCSFNSINSSSSIDDSKNKKDYTYYIHFFSLFFEFSFVFKNYRTFISKKGFKSEITYAFPNFIQEGMIFAENSDLNNLENWLIYDQYKLIIEDLKKIYDLKNIFTELKIPTNELEKDDDVYHLDIDVIEKLVNEIVYKKELRGKYKDKIELLFTSYAKSGYLKNFPLINILTLYKCVLLNYEDNIDKNKLIQILNEIQSYIIFIILISCNIIKKDDSFSSQSLTYNHIQDNIYQNLLFIMRNIIYKYTKNLGNKEDKKNEKEKKINNDEINTNTNNIINDEIEGENGEDNDYNEEENDSYFITVLNNVISVLSSVYTKDKNNQNKSNSFLWKKSKINNDISLTGVSKLLTYYMKIFESFFNNDNIHFFSNNNNSNSNFLIIQQKNNFYNIFIKNINNSQHKGNDKSNSELFDYKLFKNICIGRENELKKKLRLLLKANQDNNILIGKKGMNIKYMNLLVKINFLQMNDDNYNNKLIEESRDEIFKIKNYRKIKKYLYSFNNSFSNLDVFYTKNSKYHLPYKIYNYLSKDNTHKLIVPILDFDYYLPHFRKFKVKDRKLFKKDLINKLYKINLKILDNPRIIVTPDINNEHYYLYNDTCFITTTHHIRGKIFYKTEKDNKNIDNYFLYFTPDNTLTEEYLLENCADYDSSNKTCFGSTLRNNLSQKDDDIYLKMKFSNINFIFFRKYCFRNNAMEIFMNNHKSYYFKFKNTNTRDNFIERFMNVFNQKKIFKKIKSIDENNKSIILGYYNNIDNNKNYKSINDIKDLWKNNKISTLEYIMWINIYGNRSFRDTAQYPVLPWILSDYTLNKVENIINFNAVRNFNLPMGMMSFDEKSNSRKEGYIFGYKLMVGDIAEEFNIKLPNNSQDDEEDIKFRTLDSIKNISSGEISKEGDEDSGSNRNNSSNSEKEDVLKIPDFKYDIEKLYYNKNIEYERIPYIFGTYFSNPMYVSHYLMRLFPYCFNMIEIQGDGFDCSERLFFNLKNTFFSSTHEKCDLRELIPEFFTLPEIFLNINKFDFGKTEDKYYISNVKNEGIEDEKNEENNNIINTNTKYNCGSPNSKVAQIEGVVLPPWTNQSPYYFIQIMKEIFEGGIEMNKKKEKFININPWLDLIFGYYQRGMKAQIKGNIFIPAVYDGVIDSRVKEEELLKNRSEKEYLMRFFEIGVSPTKVFEKECKEIKKEVNYQITTLKNNNEIFNLNKKNCVKLNIKNKIIYFECNQIENNKLFFIDSKYEGYNIIVQKNNEDSDNSNKLNEYSINYSQIIKDFPLSEIKRKNLGYKFIIKTVFKGLLYIVAGFYDGALYLINTAKKVNKRSGYNIISELNSKENNLLQNFGNKLITCLEISEDEKYMICGNEVGSLIIYSLNYSLFIENKKYIELLKIIKSHTNKINSISINNNLFLFSDCSYDGYINIYTYPKFTLVNSLYINDSKIKKNEIDYVFLSSQPLPVIVLYSNKKCLFKVYSINGKYLDYEEDDLALLKEIDIVSYIDNNMIDPIIFTDYKFNDYLAYIFKYNFVIIRKFPEMKIHLKINYLQKNHYLSKLTISHDLKYLYAYEETDNNIYIVNNNISKKDP